MNKREFLEQLEKGLSDLPKNDIEERLAFYSEMIDDRMEEGISEEDAVAGIGSVDDIVAQILSEIPLSKIVKERIKPKRRLKAWEILFLILGFPVWFSLLCAAFSVVISFYAASWSVIASLWAVFVALGACAISCIGAGIGFAVLVNRLSGAAVISVGLISAGLCIFAFFGCHYATRCILMLTKKFALCLKRLFVKKEGAI